MRRTEGRAKHDPIFRRSVGEIVSAVEEQPITTLPYREPDSPHPITEFFSERARYNAATMECRSGAVAYLINVSEGMFYSTKATRPPNPAFFFETEIPYPVGFRDYNGSSMSFGWTPLAYMLYYDRANSPSKALKALWNASHERYARDLWCAFLRKGMLLKFDSSMHMLSKIVGYTDPPIEWLIDLLWEPESEQRQNGEAMVAFETAARDFQFKWNCGEWFDPNSNARTTSALRKALAI